MCSTHCFPSHLAPAPARGRGEAWIHLILVRGTVADVTPGGRRWVEVVFGTLQARVAEGVWDRETLSFEATGDDTIGFAEAARGVTIDRASGRSFAVFQRNSQQHSPRQTILRAGLFREVHGVVPGLDTRAVRPMAVPLEDVAVSVVALGCVVAWACWRCVGGRRCRGVEARPRAMRPASFAHLFLVEGRSATLVAVASSRRTAAASMRTLVVVMHWRVTPHVTPLGI